jgi:uncharacterized membrane protein
MYVCIYEYLFKIISLDLYLSSQKKKKKKIKNKKKKKKKKGFTPKFFFKLFKNYFFVFTIFYLTFIPTLFFLIKDMPKN